MMSKNKIIFSLLIFLISISSISIASASMEIYGGAFSTNGGLDDLTYASIDVGTAYSGDDVIVQIWYSRDGSILNDGNMVPKTVTSDGYINIRSADAYKFFPDKAEINIYDTGSNLICSKEVSLYPESGIQTFGLEDYDHSYISGGDSGTSTSSSSGSGSGGSNYNSGTSSSYVGNSETGKFHAPGCGDVNKMDPGNKIFFSSRDEAISSGYSPCGHCHP